MRMPHGRLRARPGRGCSVRPDDDDERERRTAPASGAQARHLGEDVLPADLADKPNTC